MTDDRDSLAIQTVALSGASLVWLTAHPTGGALLTLLLGMATGAAGLAAPILRRRRHSPRRL